VARTSGSVRGAAEKSPRLLDRDRRATTRSGVAFLNRASRSGATHLPL
jgi:hypothetical protein